MTRPEVNTINDILGQAVRRFPDNIALTMGDDDLTYSQLDGASKKIALFLGVIGIGRGDRVAILSENRTEWGVVFFGILRAGAVAVCLDPLLTPQEIDYIICHSGTSCLFVSTGCRPILNRIPETRDRMKDLIDIDGIAEAPFLMMIRPGDFKGPVVGPDDTAVLIYTSGTTGSQKGVELTHGNIASDCLTAVERVPYDPGTVVFSLLPLSHMYGINIGMLAPMLDGGRVVHTPSLKGFEILKTMERTRPHIMIVVPLMMRIFQNTIREKVEASPRWVGVLFDLLRGVSRRLSALGVNAGPRLFKKVHATFGGRVMFFLCGGAPIEAEVERWFLDLGLPIYPGYGLTETSPVVAVNSPAMHRVGSVGKTLGGAEIKISPEGEILIKGPMVMKGYFENDEATAQVIKDGWFHTGDIGEFDSDGYLFIKGREKNVIVTNAGLKIFPEEIEAALSLSPWVKEVAVLGMKSNGDERPHAVIHPDFTKLAAAGHSAPADIEAVFRGELEGLQRGFAPYKKVTTFTIWEEELPKTTTRKVKRKVLAAEMARFEEKARLEGMVKKKSHVEAIDEFGEGIRKVMCKTASIDPARVTLDSDLTADLGVDSLMKIEVLAVLEREMDIHIPDETAYEIVFFRDLVETAREYFDNPGFAREQNIFADIDSDISDIISESPLYEASRFASCIAMKGLSKAYFSLEVRGREKLPKEGSYILASNHTSLLDYILIYTSLPFSTMIKTAAPAAKDVFFTNPISSWLIQSIFRAFPLERYGNFLQGLRVCARIIRTGRPLVLFPEGGRSKDGKLMPFKPGIGMLSLELGVPIVPAWITGAIDSLPKGASFPKPAKVKVTFGDPVYPGRYAEFRGAMPDYRVYQGIIRDLRERIEALGTSQNHSE